MYDGVCWRRIEARGSVARQLQDLNKEQQSGEWF